MDNNCNAQWSSDSGPEAVEPNASRFSSIKRNNKYLKLLRTLEPGLSVQEFCHSWFKPVSINLIEITSAVTMDFEILDEEANWSFG